MVWGVFLVRLPVCPLLPSFLPVEDSVGGMGSCVILGYFCLPPLVAVRGGDSREDSFFLFLSSSFSSTLLMFFVVLSIIRRWRIFWDSSEMASSLAFMAASTASISSWSLVDTSL